MNHKLAVLLMAALIGASVFIGNWRTLSVLENDLETAFVSGVNGDGFSIQKDLDTVYTRSYDLLSAAKTALDPANPLIASVESDRDALQTADGPAAKYAACQDLLESVKSLYFAVLDPSVPLKMAYGDILSAAETMKLDGYNSLVLQYNSVFNGFPTRQIGTLLGFEPAELFG